MLKQFLYKHEKTLIILAVAAGLTGLLMSFHLQGLEASLYDFRVSKSAQLTPDPDIVLVTLDDNTTKTLDEFSPLTLDFHALFMESLERLEPRAVGYLVDLNRVNQANPDLIHTDWASRFVQAARRLQDRGTPVVLGTAYDVTGEVLPPYPLSSLPHSLAIIHKDGNVFSEDKVTRRALLELNGKPVFHAELARLLGIPSPADSLNGVYSVPEIDGKYFFFRYHGSTTQNHYFKISFLDILKGNLPVSSLRGKTILVGTLSRENSGDFALTPYSSVAFTNPKLAIHANILDSILHQRTVTRLPEAVNWIVTFGSALFVLWWVLNSTPLYGLFAILGMTLTLILSSQVLFQFSGIWLKESQPLLAIFAGYYLAVPYRLIREYKKRWDYQRKNELLTQVEELKTNFLNLVTHDLKTPVARIQGLAEVLLRKSSDRLIDRDRETLHHIISSTDELNRFISSILELSKVESKNLKLNLESKDLNQLIERSLEGFKAQARSKRIVLQSSLEPLFPIKIDASLISKVINNVIDNAIKYSPESSVVSVESREVGEWVEIAVRDQGVGMSEHERENLFTRFYRAKNEATAQTAGTGLGLYLTRYFIHAHRGRVEVESESGKGSTFKIYLPVQMTVTGIELAVEREESVIPGLTRRLKKLIKKESSHV